MFNENLKRCLDASKLDQKKCASELGVSYSTFGGWVRGKTEPSFNNLVRIADHFNVSVDFLLDHERSGRWEYVDGNGYRCSSCKIEWELDPEHDPFIDEMYYCPKCGRRMRSISKAKK